MIFSILNELYGHRNDIRFNIIMKPTCICLYISFSFLIIVLAQQCVVNILHNSEHPASCFSVTESGQILVSDLLFEDLMSKLTMAKAGRESFYSQRKGFKIESRGQRYEVGDFIIKIGSVSLASNFRGILIEVCKDCTYHLHI